MKTLIRVSRRLCGKHEKGFTLIELLVVIAILGVLAAVVVPNASRMIGKGRREGALEELHSVQTAVVALMAAQDPALTAFANPTNPHTGPATNNMAAFPDTTYVLYGATPTERYMMKTTTSFYYTCNSAGEVKGYLDVAKTDEIGDGAGDL